jgi:hypothetical protein
MGNTGSSYPDGLYSSFYNPAGVSGIRDFEFVSTISPGPVYYSSSAYYLFNGLGYRFNRYLQVGFSNFLFNYNERVRYSSADEPDRLKSGGVPYSNSSTLTLASEPVKNLFLGVNLSLMTYELGIPEKFNKVLCSDFGVIKKIKFKESALFSPSLNLSAGIRNLNGAQMSLRYNRQTITEPLPVIAIYGASYALKYNKTLAKHKLQPFEFLAALEVMDLLNSNYNTAIRSGVEATLLEIVSLRAGFYSEKTYNYNLPQHNRSVVNKFTYGIGLQAPFYKLGTAPWNFRLDISNMPQTNYVYRERWPNYTSISLKAEWLFKQ